MNNEQYLLTNCFISKFESDLDENIIFNQVDHKMFKHKLNRQIYKDIIATDKEDYVFYLNSLDDKKKKYLNSFLPEEYSTAINLNKIVNYFLIEYYNNELTNSVNFLRRKELIKKLEELQDEEVEEDDVIDLLLREEEKPLVTGYNNLDNKLGLRRKNTYIIGAGTGKGKSTLALNIATKLSVKGNRGAYFSLEMSKEEVYKSICSSMTSINNYKFRNQDFSDHEKQLVYQTSERIKSLGLDVIDNIYNYYAIESLIKKHNYDFVVIDYVGLVEHNEKDVRIRTSKISRSLKILSKELNCCIITVAQLNRLAETERPSVAHLAESADLERDASGVMLISRDRGERHAELIIAKNRFGMCTNIDLHFELEFSRIKEESN